jgi:hypothetical protein
MAQSANFSSSAEQLRGRELEAYLLSRLALMSRSADSARDSMEANVLGLTASLLLHRYPQFAKRCWEARCAYFGDQAHSQQSEMSAAEIVRRGWVLSLPRWREAAERVALAQR